MASPRRLLSRWLRRHFDLSRDIRTRLPKSVIKIIFDVGAAEGKATARYRQSFRSAHVFAFEPNPETFRRLKASTARDAQVTCLNLAMSSSEGTGTFVVEQESPSTSRLAPGGEAAVQLTTVDAFSAAHSVDRIDLLKIDTEGHEMEVLKGAEAMLGDRISIIYAECGVDPESRYHSRFEDVKSYLEARGYRLFGIYEQIPQRRLRLPNLRRVDAAFISLRVMELNAGNRGVSASAVL